MTPTKRQIARVIRQAAKSLTPRNPLQKALFAVSKKHGTRGALYYDAAVRCLKAHTPLPFASIVRLPTVTLQREMRRAARALEHGLHI